MSRPRSDRPSRLGEVLRVALDRLPVARELADHALWVHWESVVGATLVPHVRPLRLRRGVLFVAADGPTWMQEMQFLKRELRDRLNARLGRAVVRDIFVVLKSDR